MAVNVTINGSAGVLAGTATFTANTGGGGGSGNIISGGTPVGDLTEGGGLAAARDGNLSKSRDQSARSGDAASGWIAIPVVPARAIQKGVTYGSNNVGYKNPDNPTITVKLRGKNGAAPANGTDGALLGSTQFTDTSNESATPREIVSSDQTTLYDWLIFEVSHNSSPNNIAVAQVIGHAVP